MLKWHNRTYYENCYCCLSRFIYQKTITREIALIRLKVFFFSSSIFQIHRNMGSSGSKPDSGLQRSRTQSSIVGNNSEMGHGKGDIFKEIKGEMKAIERSRSKTDVRMQHHLQKSASKSRFLDEIRVRRSRAQSAHSMTFEEENKIKEDHEKEDLQKIQKEKEDDQLKEEEEEEKRREEEEQQRKLKEEEEEKKRKSINPYDDAPKKMDDIFGPMRGNSKSTVSGASKVKKKEKSPSPPPKAPTPPSYTPSVYVDPDFDPNKKEISGMSESVKLKKTAKNRKEPAKKDVPENKLSTREKMLGNLGKPAKFPKPKPAEKPKEPSPSPPPLEEKEPTPQPLPPEEPKEPSPIVLIKEPTPVKEPTPKPKSPLPPPPQEEELVEEYRSPSPTKMLPPKIGINGFNGVGRIVLRAAIESGLDVKAINDPFVPLQYMVYTLKFDLAMSPGGVDSQSKMSRDNKTRKREIHSVRESPTGQLIVNGNAISVFVEHDVTKIPWTLAGVNYVVEATDVLSSLAEARLHLSTAKRGVRLRHVIEEQELRKSQARERSTSSSTADGDPMALMYGGCKNVIIAGPSDDAPLFCVGINDDMSARGGTSGDGKLSLSQTSVASHVSAPVAALAPILYLINKSFKIKSCSYTLIRSVKGGPKR